MKQIIEWLLFTSVFAACCAVGLCMATEQLIIRHPPSLFSPLHTFVFGCTLMVYNAHHLMKRTTEKLSDRYVWSKHFMLWHYVCLVTGFILLAVSLFFLSYKIWAWCLVLGCLSLAYSLPLLPFTRRKTIREFGWIKIMVLTSVWTIVTSMLPMIYWNVSMLNYPYEILIRFVFMLTLCIAFDIRDMQTDLDAGIFTLPNIIGFKNSYRLMNFTIILFTMLSAIQYLRFQSLPRFAGALITAVVTKWVIDYVKIHSSDKAYLGLVDGVMLFYALSICLLNT